MKSYVILFFVLIVSNAYAMENDENRSAGKVQHQTYEQLAAKNRELEEELEKVKNETKRQEKILVERLSKLQMLLTQLSTKAADAARTNNNN
jgi:cell division protein FtsB